MPDRAYKTPVKDLLAAIPHDLVIQWQDKDGLASHNCPIGRLAREAIAAIEAKPEPKCKTCDDTKVVGNGTSTIPCACKVFGHKDCLLCKSTSSYRQTEITDCPDCKEPAKHAQEKT